MHFYQNLRPSALRSLLLGILTLSSVLLLAPQLSAQTTYTVVSTTVSNYPASGPMFVIDADKAAGATPPATAPYDRWFITAQTDVTANTTVAFSVSMQVRFRLVNPTGGVVPCVGADVNGYVAGAFATFSGAGAGTYSTTRSAYLVPTSGVKLDPGLLYKVEAVAISSGRGRTLGTGASGLAFRFIHFKGPNAADAPVNAVGYLEAGAGFAHTFAVQTDPANADFALSVPYTLYRYDDPTLLTQTSNVTARFTVQLFDNAAPNTPIALATTDTDLSLAIANHAVLGQVIPSKLSGFALLKFRPAPGIQLDGPGKTYFTKVTLSHFEEAADVFPVQDNATTLAAVRLLHFNGKLIFGQATANPIETTFTSITNNPSLGALLTPTTIDTSLAIAAAVVKGTTHTYTAGSLNVSLLANGNAIIRGGSSVTLVPPAVADRGSIGNVRFDRTGIVLNANGGTAATVSTILPAGMGWATAATGKTLNGRFAFGGVLLDQGLNPVQTSLTWSPPGGAGAGWVMEESKPMLISATSVSWTVASGRFDITAPSGSAAYVRSVELTQLEISPVAATEKVKCSNEQYWRYAQNTAVSQSIQSGAQGGAEFTGGYAFSNVSQLFCTHFPYHAVMAIRDGQMAITSDLINPANSWLTLPVGNPDILMRWLGGCLDDCCGNPASVPTTLQSFTPTGRILKITQDGGLVGSGTFGSGLDLRWGYIQSSGTFVHRVVTPFSNGTFAMGGIFLRGSSSSTGKVNDGPGIMLYTGVSALDGAATERPATNAYLAGRAEYPGFNVNLGINDSTASGVNGASTLAGQSYGPYALKKRCKYYVRGGGVTGIHDKVAAAPDNLILYGYHFNLANFGLSFLDNDMKDSRVTGRVVVPQPSNIFVDFAELSFLCNGGLDQAKIAISTPPETLEYWNAPIDIRALQFLHPTGCDVTKGYLSLGLDSYSSHLTDTLSGVVGFHAHGNLINKEFSDTQLGELAGLDSRFKMPKQVKFQGPKCQTAPGGFEEYILTPVADAYLNVTGAPPLWSHDPKDSPSGFWNIAGRLKVSFFESPKVHFQTTPNRPPADQNAPSPWQNSVMKVANGNWQTGIGVQSSYFDSSSYHDTWNRGFPYPITGKGTGETRDFYISDPKFLTTTQQSWLGGAINFKYKLLWNSVTRSFTSLDASASQDDSALGELAQQMVVLKIDHRLPYLSAERAEMTFGASYAGMPKISVSNFVINEIDDGTGIFKAATEAACGPIFDGLDSGLGSLSKLLNDQTRDLFTAALDPIVKPLSSNIYASLKTQWNLPGAWTPSSVVTPKLAQFRSDLNAALASTQGQLNQFGEISKLLKTTHDGLDLMIRQPDGFLATNANGDIEVARNLTKKLIELLSKELGGSTNALGGVIEDKVSELVDPLMHDAQPTLLDIRDVLIQLNEIIVQAQKAVSAGGVLVQEIQDIITAQAAELDALTTGVEADLLDYFNTFQKGLGGKNFLSLTEKEIRTTIEQAIYDRFFGTALLAKIQTAIKQQLQDVEVAIHSGVDSIFGEINKVIKKALSGLLSQVDDEINGMLGEVGKYLGSGSVIGSATFNGDALRKLRMDGKFDFKVPDDVHIEAFLEINQYTSKDTAPGCTQPTGSDSLTEVTIGALNVPSDFISPGVKLNLDAKFSFLSPQSDSLQLVGLAGGIEMAEGSINYEAFSITKLAVAVAFSSEANYFSAGIGMKMQSWGGNGGVFFGRTCTLQPIMMWDPFAAKALGPPDVSFNGIYVYGEVHIPVSEVLLGIPDSCFFSLTADAGVGFFVFAEGPSYGARMGLGIDGEVLCLLGISGRIDLLGGKINGQTRLTGTGEVCASVVFLDVCKDITISTSVSQDGSMKGKGGAK